MKNDKAVGRDKGFSLRQIIRKHDIIKKLILTAAYLGLLTVLYFLGAQCIFLSVLGIPCPGCGMSRAMLAALRLDFAAAFQYHLMFWSMPLLYLYFLFDGHLFPGRLTDRIILYLILAGFLVNWGIALAIHFC